MIEWAFALLFRPNIVKISLDSEAASIVREVATGRMVAQGHNSGDGMLT